MLASRLGAAGLHDTDGPGLVESGVQIVLEGH